MKWFPNLNSISYLTITQVSKISPKKEVAYESGSLPATGSKFSETIKACNCSKFKYNLKNKQHKHCHCSICKEEKLKWNLDQHISLYKKVGM